MKYTHSALVLVVFSALLAGCANTVDDSKPVAAAAAAPSGADVGIQKNVQTALGGEAQLADAKVNAAVKDGAVTLTGTTKNDWLKYVAETTTKKVDGVKSVKNDIVVPD